MCNVVYNTPMNTLGIGNPVPATMNTLGSGDLFQFSQKRKKIKKISKQKKINMNPPLLVYKKKG